MRTLAILGAPILAVTLHRGIGLVTGNLGTNLDLAQVLVLFLATLVTLLAIGRAMVAFGLDPRASGFAIALFFYVSASPAYVAVAALTGSLFVVQAVSVVIPLIVAVLAVRIHRPAFGTFLMGFLIVTTLFSGLQAIVSYQRAEATITTTALDYGEPEATRDLVIVVLDEYARADVLLREFGHDNSDFEAALAERGLRTIPGALANYSHTIASVPSMLSGSYPLVPGQSYTVKDRKALADMVGGENPVIDLLRGHGYEYTHIESPWADSRCTAAVDHCIGNGAFDSTTMQWFQSNHYVGPITFLYGHPFPLTAEPILGRLGETLHDIADNGRPDVVLAHVLAPHFPYTLTPDCGRTIIGSGDEPYAAQVQCVNSLLLKAIDQAAPDAVLFVTGDHGTVETVRLSGASDAWSDADIHERLPVFSAIRLAAGCREPDDDASLIRISDHAIACALGVEPRLVEERAFIVEDLPAGDDSVVEIELETLKDINRRTTEESS